MGYKKDQTKNKSGSGFSFSGMSDSALDDLQNSVNILMAWNAGQRRELETEIRNLADEELGHVVNIVKIYVFQNNLLQHFLLILMILFEFSDSQTSSCTHADEDWKVT